MARYSGKIGFSITAETVPGVWSEEIVEKHYYGEIIRNARRWESGEGVNDNFVISNQISILADPFACENFAFMKYITFMNAKWKISNIEVTYPRLTITLGGLYNENET